MSELGDVTRHNYLEAPYNKIGFWHVKDLTTTKEIENDKETSTPLPSSLVDDSFEKEFKLMFKDKFYTWDNYLKETFTDAIIIIKNGAIIYEKYFSGSESDRHLLMSVSKSVTSVCLASTLNSIGKDVTERNFDNLLLTELVPSLKKTSWEGCTLQAVLDMRSGTLFDESNYADPESDGRLIEEISGYRPYLPGHEHLPRDTVSWISSLENIRGHNNGTFEYRSILSDVAALVIETITKNDFSNVLSNEIWKKMGAEYSANVIVDEKGFPAAEGGMSATLRDCAKFGLMCLQKGEINGKQIINSKWFDRLRFVDPDLVSAYTYSSPTFPNGFYKDYWWIYDAIAGIYSAIGINGQQILIHHPSDMVIVKFSSWPFGDEGELGLQDAGLFAACDVLSGTK